MERENIIGAIDRVKNGEEGYKKWRSVYNVVNILVMLASCAAGFALAAGMTKLQMPMASSIGAGISLLMLICMP